MLTNSSEAQAEPEDEILSEHFFAMSLKLFRSALQQQNAIVNVVFKNQPQPQESGRGRMVWLQAVRYAEVSQLRDVLLDLWPVIQRKIQGQNPDQTTAQYRRVAGSLRFFYRKPCVVQGLVEQAPVHQTAGHADTQNGRVVKKMVSSAQARAGCLVAQAR